MATNNRMNFLHFETPNKSKSDVGQKAHIPTGFWLLKKPKYRHLGITQ